MGNEGMSESDKIIIAELDKMIEVMKSRKEQLVTELHDLDIRLKDKTHAKLLVMGKFHTGGRKKVKKEKGEDK
jgi:ABC-type cobalamin transport system ATPase subunit